MYALFWDRNFYDVTNPSSRVSDVIEVAVQKSAYIYYSDFFFMLVLNTEGFSRFLSKIIYISNILIDPNI